MDQDTKEIINRSTNDAIKHLRSAIQSAHQMAPGAVVLIILLSVAVVWLTMSWAPAMIATTTLLVMSISIGIFCFRDNFGEAVLSFVGGLFTIFAFEWTPERYVAFWIAWIVFVCLLVLISSLKLYAKTEEICSQAAHELFRNQGDHKEHVKLLQRTATTLPVGVFSIVERAEMIRLFSFRELPIALFVPAMKVAESLAIITKVDVMTVARFVVDFYLSVPPDSTEEALRFADILYTAINTCPVPPEEFFEAFETSRRLLISSTVPPELFLTKIRDCLISGVPQDEMYTEIRRHSEQLGGS